MAGRFLILGMVVSMLGARCGIARAESPPLLAIPAPSPSPDLTACTDENVQRALRAASALYRGLGNGKTVPPRAYGPWVDRLWKTAPDCASPENRGLLTHHGFKQYMSAMTMEAYVGAVLKARAGRFQDARFYVRCYFALEQSGRNEAKSEKWTAWLAFISRTLPVVYDLDRRLHKAGF
jgi:hypothetical protein